MTAAPHSAARTLGLRRRGWCARRVVAGILVGVAALSRAHLATAQSDQFGRQARADAASRAIVLAVQQGISALPPTSGQSIIYAYNPHTDDFERSEKLGPFSLRTPETVGSV